MDNLTGRRVAIDASMALYQFLVAVRMAGQGQNPSMQLTNAAGDVTSHIQGMFNRTIKMMSCGVRPLYVFDGKPPQMKGGELAKRMARRAKAETELAAAVASDNADEIDKFSRRLVKVCSTVLDVLEFVQLKCTKCRSPSNTMMNARNCCVLWASLSLLPLVRRRLNVLNWRRR
jgi:5'-3' exonuclease